MKIEIDCRGPGPPGVEVNNNSLSKVGLLQYDVLRSGLLSRIVYSPTLECIAFSFCRPQKVPKRHVVIPQ